MRHLAERDVSNELEERCPDFNGLQLATAKEEREPHFIPFWIKYQAEGR